MAKGEAYRHVMAGEVWRRRIIIPMGKHRLNVNVGREKSTALELTVFGMACAELPRYLKRLTPLIY